MAKKSVYFPIVFHFHQPVDNFEWVFDDCYEKSYGPLIDQMFKHSKVKFTLHFTGSLLHWLMDEKPEFKKKLEIMVARGQVEIIGGGYYEPIFALIPERDQIAQMKMLADSVKERLGYDVKGAWLSERVWEPTYPRFLSKAGLNYIIVDDNHLKGCGLSEEETFYSYTTEDCGNVITVFPINETIRYLAPWKPAKDAIEYLEKNAGEKGDRLILFLSDAEKMGVWGTTHELCYVKGHKQEDDVPYIEALFSAVERSEIIKPVTLSEYINKHSSKGLVYIPTATYDKMEEWVLPTPIRIKMEELKKTIKKDTGNLIFPPEVNRFMKGGFWRYFLVKYPESNNMHKKMLYVRNRLIKMEENAKNLKHTDNISKETVYIPLQRAWDEIYRAQCNDCYWHGQFGGVYLHFLRHAVYSHLIKAEKIINRLEERWNLISDVSIQFMDFDKDSRTELIASTDKLWMGFKPSDGGTMFELDFKPRNYNLLNTLTRWYEAYHEVDKVAIDRWRKSAFRDHFIDEKVTAKDYIDERYYDYGDFVDGNYTNSIEQNENDHVITMVRNGNVTTPKKEFPLKIEKNISFNPENTTLQIEYELNSVQGYDGDLNSDVQELDFTIDIPFMFSGDPNEFSCICDEKEEPFFEAQSLRFRKIMFKDPLYGQEISIIMENDDEFLVKHFKEALKYQISAYARTNNGYKDVYEGMNLALRFNVNEILGKKIRFKIEIH